MNFFIIRFVEVPSIVGSGSLTVDSEKRSIQNINNEDEVKKVVEASFENAIKALNNGVKAVTFSVANENNVGMWIGEGNVIEEKLNIISFVKK